MSGSNGAPEHVDCSINRGFWLDLRSKRDISKRHLDQYTASGYNYYDPLLSPKIGVVDLMPPGDWVREGFPRSWRLNLHSFRFADYWILQYQRGSDAGIIERLAEVSIDYIESIWTEHGKRSQLEFAVSDVSVASRTAVFSFVLSQGKKSVLSRAESDLIEVAMEEHIAYSAADENYNSNNHGLFNDLHLLIAIINFPEMKDAEQIAQKVAQRFTSTFVERQISQEYIHLEHTPSYALLWLIIGEKARQVFNALDGIGLPVLEEATQNIIYAVERVKRNLWWFIRPDGSLANFGDQGQVVAPGWLRSIEGRYGYEVFAKSGYGFYKSETSYLALAAAYHKTKIGREGYRSSSHKQRDELSLLWSEAEGPILVDTGLRAFDYGPERRFTYSKQAHNTLSVDPVDFMVGGIMKYMDGTAPYGSGIIHAHLHDESSEMGVIAGEDRLLQLKGIYHGRILLYMPGSWLIVMDSLRLPKGARAEWNFHFHERWRCKRYGVSGALLRSGRKRLAMTMYSSARPNSPHMFLHRGDFEPLRGWRFAGDPIAVTQLRRVEWIERKHPYTKLTLFALGAEHASLSGVELITRGNMMEIEFSLSRNGDNQRIHRSIELDGEVFPEIFRESSMQTLIQDAD